MFSHQSMSLHIWPRSDVITSGCQSDAVVFGQKFYGRNQIYHKGFAQTPGHCPNIPDMIMSLLRHMDNFVDMPLCIRWGPLLLLVSTPSLKDYNEKPGNPRPRSLEVKTHLWSYLLKCKTELLHIYNMMAIYLYDIYISYDIYQRWYVLIV